MEHDMPLEPELNALKERWTARVGPDTATMMVEDIAAQVPMIEKALRVGDLFPSVALTDQLSRPIDIATGAKLQPLVITFYRSGSCPYCHLELHAYQRILFEIEKFGARLVAVSPEAPDNTLTAAQKNELTFAGSLRYRGHPRRCALASATGCRNP